MARPNYPNNVYWEEPRTGRAFTYSDGMTRGYPSMDAMEEQDDVNVPLQGTLFDPETGTASKFDPLIGPERRREAVRQRYNVEDDEVVEKIAQSSLPTTEMLGMGPNLAPNTKRSYNDRHGEKLSVASDPAFVAEGSGGSYDPVRHTADLRPDNMTSRVVMHEIGHGEHLRGSILDAHKRNGGDSLFEGVADGFADRYESVVDVDPGRNDVNPKAVGRNSATSPSVRHERIRDPRSEAYGADFSGFTIEGKSYPGWETDTERALYAAARQHVATTGQVPKSDFRAEHMAQKKLSLSQFTSSQMLDSSGMPGFRDKLGLGRLVYENPEVMRLFDTVGPEHEAEWLNMRNAASDAVTTYKAAKDQSDVERGRRPLGPEAGWKASEEGMRRHNEAMQSSTLPLVDPQTGKQYDNTVPTPEHPLPRIEHTKQTDREAAAQRAEGIRKTLGALGNAYKDPDDES